MTKENNESDNFKNREDIKELDDLENIFQNIIKRIRKGDKLLRELEKTSKTFTQHVQTSIISFNFEKNKE